MATKNRVILFDIHLSVSGSAVEKEQFKKLVERLEQSLGSEPPSSDELCDGARISTQTWGFRCENGQIIEYEYTAWICPDGSTMTTIVEKSTGIPCGTTSHVSLA
jgi:hypothetical protein